MNFVNFVVSFLAGTVMISPTIAAAPKLSVPSVKVNPPVVVVVEKVKPKVEIKAIIKTEVVTPGGDCSEYTDIINSYDWPADIAFAVCSAESQGNTYASNLNDVHHKADGSVLCVGSYGLMQIACFWPKAFGHERGDLLNPETNIKIAYMIWKEEGFCPWSTYLSPKCHK